MPYQNVPGIESIVAKIGTSCGDDAHFFGTLRRASRVLQIFLCAALILATTSIITCSGEAGVIPDPAPFVAADPPTGFALSKLCPPGLLKEGDACSYDLAHVRDLKAQGGLGPTVTQAALDPRKIDLGRYLFFDPILSGDQTLSCAHCHHPAYGLSDGRRASMGAGGMGWGPARDKGEKLTRSAPSLWNAAFNNNLFWDGRAATLEDQIEGPLFAKEEMASSEELIRARLSENKIYRRLFAQTFGHAESDIEFREVVEAIATFERSLVSLNSRYDRWSTGETHALTPVEVQGFNVFRSFVARCSECHSPPLFANGVSAVIGAPDTGARDLGREKITGQPLLRGSFRVPSIRNIARTAPYMHSGVFGTLADVVEFYNKGAGHGISGPGDLHLHWHVRKMDLSQEERRALVAFLNSLTDEASMPVVPRRVPSGLPTVAEPLSVHAGSTYGK